MKRPQRTKSISSVRLLERGDDDMLREHIADVVLSLDIPEQRTAVTPLDMEGVFEVTSDALTWLERGTMCEHCEHVWSTYD
jgi:hypothetical protein